MLNGIDVLKRDKFAPLRGLRVGLITNHTGMDRERNATIDLLRAAPELQLKVLFSPEHGIRGALDDNKITDSVDQKSGLPVYSLYVGDRRKPLPEQLKGLDALVFDIQDIGCRFYTYVSTMGNCLEAAAEAKLKFFVLDRVNPIGGVVLEGSLPDATKSFIAFHSIPLRHGMTAGELARMFNSERGWKADLTVVQVENWQRAMWFDACGQPWINPSPNMRNLTEAALYPGIGILEMSISVGRGTDTPFEVLGAPYVDDVKLAEALNAAGLPGIRFVPVRFTPDASVFKGKECGGVYLVLTERDRCPIVDVGLQIACTLQKLYPKEFALDKVQTLLQDKSVIEGIRAGKSVVELKQPWAAELEEFRKRREGFLLYR
ncbi:hypothetical protein AYO49_04410 [Verrucomicrobiaceae bacterium SCGC AG-212-N21]|nr:hypothetical protein AYO49_04410 [Verrucomicrobiaceae bacterium SCGC AG-212-N21]